MPCIYCPEARIEVVWHEDKQTQLIESIFHNFTVPQVVFAVRREENEESRICVDGKQVCEQFRQNYMAKNRNIQRLTSIVQFFDGLVSAMPAHVTYQETDLQLDTL